MDELGKRVNKPKHLRAWEILFLRWHGLIISFTSILYGSWLIIHTDILDTYKTYAIVNNMFSTKVIPWMFVIFGIMKILGIAINSRATRMIAIFGMAFIWLLFGVSFILVNMQNAIWIISISLALQCFGVAFKEV